MKANEPSTNDKAEKFVKMIVEDKNFENLPTLLS